MFCSCREPGAHAAVHTVYPGGAGPHVHYNRAGEATICAVLAYASGTLRPAG
jgi:hypothetical protein